MKFTKNTIEKIFQKWGKATTQVPTQNEIMKSTVLHELKPPEVKYKYSHLRMPWLALAGVGAIVLLVIINNDSTGQYSSVSAPMATDYKDEAYGLMEIGASTGLEKTNFDTANKSIRFSEPQIMPSPPYYNPTPETPATDRREYLKTNYSAQIKTRKVEKLEAHVTTLVRGHNGRVDSLSTNQKYSYIQFVIPKTSFELFKQELNQLVPARFITENVGQQNLLPEKRMIEDNRATTETTLTNFKKDREVLVMQHTTVASSLEKQITNAKKNLTTLEDELKKFPERKDEIAKKQTELQNEIRRLQSRLYEENNKFNNDLKQIDSTISYHESLLTSLGKQDERLIDNVETVQGSIMIEWISIPALTKLYLADYWYLLLLFIPILIFFRARPQVLDLP